MPDIDTPPCCVHAAVEALVANGINMPLSYVSSTTSPRRRRKISRSAAEFIKPAASQEMSPFYYSQLYIITGGNTTKILTDCLSNYIFTARRNARIASAVLATAIPSVCPSHAGIVSKRRHVAR